MVGIMTGDYKAQQEKLSSSEMDAFDQAFDAISTLYDTYGTKPLSGILNNPTYRSLYLAAAEMAKAQFKGATFGGLMQNTGFNMQFIRAVTVLTQNATSEVNDWSQSYSSVGWQAMFGSEANPFSTGIQNSLGPNSAAYTSHRVNIFVTHLLSQHPPEADEMQIGIGTKKYNVFPVTFERISNVYVAPLPEPVFMPLDSTYYFLANIRRLGVDTTQLLGVQYVDSSYAPLQ